MKRLNGDFFDDFVKGFSWTFELIHLLWEEFLLKDSRNSFLTNNTWETQKHIILDSMVTLEVKTVSLTS